MPRPALRHVLFAAVAGLSVASATACSETPTSAAGTEDASENEPASSESSDQSDQKDASARKPDAGGADGGGSVDGADASDSGDDCSLTLTPVVEITGNQQSSFPPDPLPSGAQPQDGKYDAVQRDFWGLSVGGSTNRTAFLVKQNLLMMVDEHVGYGTQTSVYRVAADGKLSPICKSSSYYRTAHWSTETWDGGTAPVLYIETTNSNFPLFKYTLVKR